MKSAGTDSLEINCAFAVSLDGSGVNNPKVVKMVMSPVKKNPASAACAAKLSIRKKIPEIDNTCMARNVQWTREPVCEVRKTTTIRMIETTKITTATIGCAEVAMPWRMN